ncbi:MAG TPA: dockerin type I domain-containing protein [Pirellulales bacterium]
MRILVSSMILLIGFTTVNTAWGHGLPLYISSDGNSMTTVSESPFQGNYNIFADEFGDPNDSAGLILTNEGSPYVLSEGPPSPPAGYGFFPGGTTYAFNVTSRLFFSDGGVAATTYVDPSNTTHVNQPDDSVSITIANRNEEDSTINVYGNALPAAGFSIRGNFEGHELYKILNNSTASGVYGFGFTVTATLPNMTSITSGPLADVFSTDGFDNDQAVTAVYSAIMRGDFNLDGGKTTFDIASMLQALTNLASYQAKNDLADSELSAIADVNRDGTITNADLPAFLELLKSGGGSTNAVPEPSGLALICFAFVSFVVWQWRK